MSRKARALIGSAIFLVIAPGFVAGVVPWWITGWRLRPPFFDFELTRSFGGLLIDVGAIVLVDCFIRFAREGLGTPAPVAPTERLVVTGFYRFVRNPMYLAVVNTILGQALFFPNVALFGYAALVWLAMHLFVVLYEEPTLRGTFGEEYGRYCGAVGRWIPRFTPWTG